MARLHLTGGLHLEGPEGAVTERDVPGQQARIALVALAVGRRPVSHDALAEIVWDSAPPAQWKAALTAIVSKLRSLVASTGLDGAAVLPSIAGTYAFVAPSDLWIDVEDALRRLDRAEGALRHDDLRDAAAEATVASSVLRRPLLAGVYGDWVESERRRLDDACHRSFVVLASCWIRLGDHQLATTAAEAAIAIDPLREPAHRLLIEAELGRGDRGAALRAYRRCATILDVEVGGRPSAETAALVTGLDG